MSKPNGGRGHGPDQNQQSTRRSILGHSSIHQGRIRPAAPMPASTRDYAAIQADFADKHARWEADLTQFDAAFASVMRQYRSRVNIPATLRDWIIRFKEISPILHRRAAEQVSAWMQDNRHLFPSLKLR